MIKYKSTQMIPQSFYFHILSEVFCCVLFRLPLGPQKLEMAQATLDLLESRGPGESFKPHFQQSPKPTKAGNLEGGEGCWVGLQQVAQRC